MIGRQIQRNENEDVHLHILGSGQKGRAILAGKLVELGYQFKFPTIESALQDLIEKHLETPAASAYVRNESKESDA